MEKKKNFIINVVFYAMIAAAAAAVCKFILPVLAPFLIAFVIAAVIQIPAGKIGKASPAGRKTAAVFLCGVFYIAFFLLVIVLGTKAVKAGAAMLVSAPAVYNEKVVPFIDQLAVSLEEAFSSIDDTASMQIESYFEEVSQNMGQYISDFSVEAVKWLSGGVTEIPGFIVRLVVTVVATFFITMDFPGVIGFFRGFLPAGKEEAVKRGLNYAKSVILIYLRSYALLFFMTFVELSAGLLLLGIPYAVLLALGIAVFDILPVVGTGGILLPWACILLFLGKAPMAAGILVLYLVITVIRNTVEPKLVGKQIGLHPLATLAAMFIGLKLLGIPGLILFPVTLAVLVNLEKKGVFHWKK